MRISDWSSDVCSSDLADVVAAGGRHDDRIGARRLDLAKHGGALEAPHVGAGDERGGDRGVIGGGGGVDLLHRGGELFGGEAGRSEEHTSELQSLMRISYAVFCLKKKKETMHTEIILCT